MSPLQPPVWGCDVRRGWEKGPGGQTGGGYGLGDEKEPRPQGVGKLIWVVRFQACKR